MEDGLRMNAILAQGLAAAMCLATLPAGRAQPIELRAMGPEMRVQVRAETSGEVSINAWSPDGAAELGPVLAEAVHCQGGAKPDPIRPNALLCTRALRRDGLVLEEVVDLAPIVRKLNGSKGIDLMMDCPHLEFETTSMAMTEELAGGRLIRRVLFAAGVAPPPIQVCFGYRPDRLTAIYLPLLALALALTLISAWMARAAYAALARSAVLLGTMLWMAAAAQLAAGAPLRILLLENPLTPLVALLVEFWPPLFCVALGIALGSRMRSGHAQSRKFSEILGAYAVIPLVLTGAVGSLISFTKGNWLAAGIWLAAAPAILLLRGSWNRVRARSRVIQPSGGEFKERMSALAARAGCPRVRIYISFSTRSQVAAAFALPGRSIFFTAPLVRLLSKREVDAVAAHELSHFRHSNRAVWTALGIAMLWFETPVRDLLLLWPLGITMATLVPVTVFFAALRGSRRREFAADLSAAALTGDPRAMISSLARISRNNQSPLDMNGAVEWFSSHPSTLKRIRALAGAARLDAAEVEALCAAGVAGDSYEIPAEEHGGDLFTPAWQKTNAGVYGWTAILLSCGAGLLVAWLLARFAGFGWIQVVGAVALGCLLTKGLAATVLAVNYARLRRKLEEKLGVGGELVGLALDSEPRLYNGFRFSDAGLLRFEGGRLCYQSERITIALNPADVVELGMVAASPSNWVRRQPMVRFRCVESDEVKAFILHPVKWLPTQRRLLKRIERWRAAQNPAQVPAEDTLLNGFTPIAGQPFHKPSVATAVRAALLVGAMTLVAAILARWILRAEWSYVWCAVGAAGCAQTFMVLPAMLYRMPAHRAVVASPGQP